MSSKVFKSGSDSKIEASWIGNLDLTRLVTQASYFVNPLWDSLVGKIIIINLPTDLDLKKLGQRNRLISRFPLSNDLSIKYELIPYPEVNFRLEEHIEGYSTRILNKYLLTDPNYEIKETDRFLLGTDIEVNGGLTLIGYMIIKTIKT